MSGIIDAASVAKRFGDTSVLADVSMNVRPGITGLLGSNGAGKTTFLSLVLGLSPRDGGSLSVLGEDPASAGPEVRARIGYSPEHHHLPADVQAADLVRHLAQLHGLPFRASTERASDALWLVGLGEERFRPIGTMSTGQRQRVKLAAALAHDPALLLLDEPTDGLDPVQRDDMLALIRRVGSEYGIDIVLSSHLLEEVERICDNVVILANGAVRRAGAIEDLRGESTGLIVEFDSDPTAVAAALNANGLNAQQQGNRLRIESAHGDQRAVNRIVRDVVASHDIGLRRMVDATLTLEDVFLDTASSEGG